MDQYGNGQLFERRRMRHNKDMAIDLSRLDDQGVRDMCILSGACVCLCVCVRAYAYM